MKLRFFDLVLDQSGFNHVNLYATIEYDEKEEGMSERQLHIIDIDYQIKQLKKQKKSLISREKKEVKI